MSLITSARTPAPASIIGNIRDAVASSHAAASPAAAQERKASDFWLNVGITLPGAGENGADLFVSLPVGLALDDMKPQNIRGNNANWIMLAQAKNALLEQLQAACGSLNPGDRVAVPMLEVELYRKSEPAQTADAGTNPLIAAMAQQLAGR